LTTDRTTHDINVARLKNMFFLFDMPLRERTKARGPALAGKPPILTVKEAA
jgi:hypothetical protein